MSNFQFCALKQKTALFLTIFTVSTKYFRHSLREEQAVSCNQCAMRRDRTATSLTVMFSRSA